jgi:hypothetical protein
VGGWKGKRVLVVSEGWKESRDGKKRGSEIKGKEKGMKELGRK